MRVNYDWDFCPCQLKHSRAANKNKLQRILQQIKNQRQAEGPAEL